MDTYQYTIVSLSLSLITDCSYTLSNPITQIRNIKSTVIQALVYGDDFISEVNNIVQNPKDSKKEL